METWIPLTLRVWTGLHFIPCGSQQSLLVPRKGERDEEAVVRGKFVQTPFGKIRGGAL